MARSELSTDAEKAIVDKVKSFIEKSMQDMEDNSQPRKEPENRKIFIEDLARAATRAAELIYIEHLKTDMKNIVEQLIANSTNTKLVGDIAIDDFAANTLTTVGVGPATAVPVAMVPFVPKLVADNVLLTAAKNKPLNIKTPDGSPILVL